MAAPSLAPALDSASRRSVPRFPINAALDVVVLRSGIPDNIPGRCTDLSESGIGALIAGELATGQAIAVELRLPSVGLPVRARAQVRYQERLRCGLQFVGLSAEQREKIRFWASQVAARSVADEAHDTTAYGPILAPFPEKKKSARSIHARRRRFFLLLGLVLAFAGLAWWQWQKAWNNLEDDASTAELRGSPLRVPMDKQIIYKVDPVYPEAARRAGTEGVVVLDALIAQDGTVKRLRLVAGPDELTQSALDAVQAWRFAPYRSGYEAIEVETTITLDFRLH